MPMHNRISMSVLFLGFVAYLFLFFFRAFQVIHFDPNYHVVTSGFEEESLLAMWKIGQGLPVYTDVHKIPFTASYFNWFFYAVYGLICTIIKSGFALADANIPAIGRSLTLICAVTGFWLNYKLFELINIKAWPKLVLWSLSALLWVGPLIGFWAYTLRPDVLSLLFDLLALYAFIQFYPRKKLVSIFLCALFCYLSWATKQINVVMSCTIGLYLLIERDKSVFLFSGIMAALVGATLYLGTMPYLKMMFFLDTAIPLSLEVWKDNIIQFAKKTIPISVILLSIISVISKGAIKTLWQDKVFKLTLCGLFAWSLIMLPASSKLGSAENYHFILALFLLLTIVSSLQCIERQQIRLEAGFGLMGLCMMISAGYAFYLGKDIFKVQNQNYTALQACIRELSPPVFVINSYGALPWMNPNSPPFLLAYNYWNDRKPGIAFERGGIGGLISEGYFQSLILPNTVENEFDDTRLDNYQLTELPCSGYKVFVKRDIG